MTEKFKKAHNIFTLWFKLSANQAELAHAQNTLHWLKILSPQADEILQLAAFAHDIERSVSRPVNPDDYNNYNEYKKAHAQRSGQIASEAVMAVGFSKSESNRIARIIENAEFPSEDPETQLVCDSDSISFFDNNIEVYTKRKGIDKTQYKANFMYERASAPAKQYIESILDKKGLRELILDH